MNRRPRRLPAAVRSVPAGLAPAALSSLRLVEGRGDKPLWGSLLTLTPLAVPMEPPGWPPMTCSRAKACRPRSMALVPSVERLRVGLPAVRR